MPRRIIRQQRVQLRRDIKGDVASFVRIAHMSRVAMIAHVSRVGDGRIAQKAQHADELAALALVIGYIFLTDHQGKSREFVGGAQLFRNSRP